VQIEAVAISSGQECLAAIVDISARRQQEKQLIIMHAELAARAAELVATNSEPEAFNYTVSQDLRLPLTVIHNYCHVLSERFFSRGKHYVCKQTGNGFAEGRIRYCENIVDGLENAPAAFIGLLGGKNFGKLVVNVSPD